MNENFTAQDRRAEDAWPGGAASLRRPWHEAIRGSRRLKNQRVVPLPIGILAVAMPLLVAWAGAAPADAPLEGDQRTAATSLPEPLRFLGRGDRVPDSKTGYVDVWGPPAPWEVDVLQRRGAVPSRR